MRRLDRLIKLSSGKLLFTSDLQGALHDFEQVLLKYSELRRAGEADFLVFGGDLLHAYPGYRDNSLELLQRLSSLREKDPNIILLMGNHELSHVLHWRLRKGRLNFTEELEEMIKGAREEFATLLSRLPFGIVTQGGVLLQHTGPSKVLGSLNLDDDGDEKLWDWFWNIDFQESMPNGPAPLKVFKPEFGSNLLNTVQGKLLWEAFMNKNEFQYEDYPSVLSRYLKNFQGTVSFIISGHIPVATGAKKLFDHQLRICSGYGAQSDREKKLLLIDASLTYKNLGELEAGLVDLF